MSCVPRGQRVYPGGPAAQGQALLSKFALLMFMVHVLMCLQLLVLQCIKSFPVSCLTAGRIWCALGQCPEEPVLQVMLSSASCMACITAEPHAVKISCLNRECDKSTGRWVFKDAPETHGVEHLVCCETWTEEAQACPRHTSPRQWTATCCT